MLKKCNWLLKYVFSSATSYASAAVVVVVEQATAPTEYSDALVVQSIDDQVLPSIAPIAPKF